MILLLANDGLPIDLPATILRIVHIGAAILAAGGAFFQLMALHPALAALSPEQRLPIREAVMDRWRKVVFICIALLLLSGLLNFMLFKLPELKPYPSSIKGMYHGLFGLKVIAALGSFHAASVLALPGAKGQRYRDNAGFWLRFLAIMLLIVILAGSALRNFKPALG